MSSIPPEGCPSRPCPLFGFSCSQTLHCNPSSSKASPVLFYFSPLAPMNTSLVMLSPASGCPLNSGTVRLRQGPLCFGAATVLWPLQRSPNELFSTNFERGGSVCFFFFSSRSPFSSTSSPARALSGSPPFLFCLPGARPSVRIVAPFSTFSLTAYRRVPRPCFPLLLTAFYWFFETPARWTDLFSVCPPLLTLQRERFPMGGEPGLFFFPTPRYFDAAWAEF